MSETKIPTGRLDGTVEFDFSEVATNDGTAALPAYSFTSAQNLGIFKPATDTLAIATAGLEQWRVGGGGNWTSQNSGVLRTGDGTSSLPGLSFSNGTNHGLYRISSTTFGLSAAGTALMSFNGSTTTVNIGSPGGSASPLSIASPSGATTSFGLDTILANNYTQMLMYSAGTLQWALRNTGTLTAPNNHLSFVNASSTEILQILQGGQVNYANGSASVPAMAFISTPSTGIYTLGDNSIRFSMAGTQRHIFDSSSLAIVSDSAQLNLTRSSNGRSPLIGIYDAFGGFRFHTPNTNAESTTVAYQFQCDNPSANSVLATVLANGQWQYVDGTSTTPAMAFISDPDTGIYRGGANVLSLAAGATGEIEGRIGGTQVMDITSTMTYFANQILKNPTGTAGAPDYSFLGDTDTGIYRGVANEAWLVAGATQVARWKYSGTSAQFVVGSGSLTEPSLCIAGNLTHGFYRVPGLDVTGTTVPIGAQFGSAATPSYTFAGDEDTGMYHSATNVLSFTAAGGLVLSMDGANSQVLYQSGAAATPTVTFIGDTDTGLYRSAANTVVVAGAGSNSLVVSDIEVTCGTGRMLQIQDGTAASPGIRFNSNQNTGLYRPAANTVAVSSNGTKVMQVSTGGIQAATIDGGSSAGGFGEQRSLTVGANNDFVFDADATALVQVRTFNNVNTASNTALFYFGTSATDAHVATIMATTGSDGKTITASAPTGRTLRIAIGAGTGSAQVNFIRLANG